MDAKYDALSEPQKEAAELMVDGAINKKKNPKEKPMTQTAIAETVGVTDRTLRNWKQDELFLDYVGYLSRVRLQAAMPDFVGVLISNLDKGQNVSTKQLDLIAKVADWMPERGQSGGTTVNVNMGHLDLDERVAQLQERRRKEVYDAPVKEVETEVTDNE